MSSIDLKISNLQAFNRKLNAVLDNEVKTEAKKRMERATKLVRGAAISDVQRGVKSGTTYEKYKPRRTHTASAPGQAPATDTGQLVSSISTRVKTEGRKVIGEIVADAPYAQALEFGTRKMMARPFMQPALSKNARKVEAIFKKRYFR